MYYTLMQCLRLVLFFYDIGIYEEAVGDIKEITEDDYFELALRGISSVAPLYDMEELGEDHCCGGHVVHHFSDPAIPEYYRLCRLYEYKHSITPEENPYVVEADKHYILCLNNTNGEFATNFDDEKHPKEIWVETCPERYAYEHEIIELVHEVLAFFRAKVEDLRAELLRGPVIWLPALPPHKAPVPDASAKPKRVRKPRIKPCETVKKAS